MLSNSGRYNLRSASERLSGERRGRKGLPRPRDTELPHLLRWRSLWLLLILFTAGVVGAYQSPQSFTVNAGSPQDQAYLRNFHARLTEGEKTYRWSDVYGYVQLPGLGGSRPFTVTLTLDPERTAQVEVIINGERMYKGELLPGWQTLQFYMSETHPAALLSRDTVVEVRAPAYRTADEPAQLKGIKLDTLAIAQAQSGGFIVPAISVLILAVTAVGLSALTIAKSLTGIASPGRMRILALAAAGAVALAILWGLATDRIAWSAAIPHLAATLLSALLILYGIEAIVRRYYPKASRRVGSFLALTVAIAFSARVGGMALPQSVIIDIPWHIKWLRTLLAGDWQSLYFPGGLSAVPREWGVELLIPKSPLFYFVAAPLSWLPFDLETLTLWFVCALDASLVLLVFWLTRRVSASRGPALFAAALYAVMPLAFRALAYGILPTIFAQWLAAIAFASLLALWGRRWRAQEWAGLLLVLIMTLLAFPTVAVFVTLVLALFAVAARPPRFSYGHAAPTRLGIALAGSWALALLVYYGLYIEPVIASAQALLGSAPGRGETVRWPGGIADLLRWTSDYIVTPLPAILGALGLGVLFSRRRDHALRRLALYLIALWASIAPLFFLVNFRVDMIGKHLFFVMVPVAVAGGMALWGYGVRGRWGRALAAISLLITGWQGLLFWVERLVRASS